MSQNETEPAEKVLLVPDSVGEAPRSEEEEVETEVVSAPSKVLRIGTMIKTLLDEVRQGPTKEE